MEIPFPMSVVYVVSLASIDVVEAISVVVIVLSSADNVLITDD